MKFSRKVSNGPLNTMIKFWWRSGSPSGYRDCFPDSSLVGETESGSAAASSHSFILIRQMAGMAGLISDTGKTCRGGGRPMHCASASSYYCCYHY